MQKNITKNRKTAPAKAQEYEPIKQHKTPLERYYERGDLDLPNSKFSAEDRKTAGEMLAYDFYRGHHKNIQALQIFADHIPTTGEQGEDIALEYRERYLRAVQSIPREFWPAVRRVCIEEQLLKSEDDSEGSQLKNKNNIYFQKMLLKLGLERLIEYYLKKNKKSS